jgi:predicted transporter
MVHAVLAGVIIDRQWFDEQRFDLVRNTVLLLMMPVFFLSRGCARSGTLAAWRCS